MARTFFIEGYGCSLNIAETEKTAGFLIQNKFSKVDSFLRADFIIINTCSVKQVTEQRMLSRIKFLLSKKKRASKLIVMGCLASAQHETIWSISNKIIVLDNSLSSLCRELKIKPAEFSPSIPSISSRKCVSIIPVSTGCLGSCTYCSARLARRELKSYSPKSILTAFRSALRGGAKEIWLTSQDMGCYGFDIKTDLPSLLKLLLKEKGEFRLRIGMMNPNHFLKIRKDLVSLFSDERLYKFLHLPLQSASDRILKAMNRKYSVKEFDECVLFAKKNIPNVSLATDIIVGFPGESEEDFLLTLNSVKKYGFDVINISRFGKRKGTVAEKMPLQLTESTKKDRSRILSVLCDTIFEKNNPSFIGRTVLCLVSEKTKNGFNARTGEYRTVFINSSEDLLGKFVSVRINAINGHYFLGSLAK